MAIINISIDELICKDPEFTHVTYTGNRYEFDLGWTSIGDDLLPIDSSTSLYLQIQLFHPGDPNFYYHGSIPIPIHLFETNHYLTNILDYEPTFSSKDRLMFTLILAGESTCYNETNYNIPPDTIP